VGHAVDDRAGGVVGRGEALVQAHPAGVVEQDEIGEGAADVDAEAHRSDACGWNLESGSVGWEPR
jgi:hypothetical protein